MDVEKMSCADCGNPLCNSDSTDYTAFCATGKMNPEFLEKVTKKYYEEDNLKFMQTAASVEYDGYCQLTRVQEIALFAKRMGYKKLGIATCVGLLKETRTLAKILRSHGFEVYGIGCKVGKVSKQGLGIPEECNAIGKSICNPIMQAAYLEKEGTEFNIVMGLCVGHDSVFYKYSAAPVTTLVTKDRVLGHNPVAALYTSEGFYSKKLFGDCEE
ncbi:MAG: DUF1847 domain-containing protein [Lachnospiraceae bacterium]|nr:DUF1847 domain-containing protein [Lachnospiraceae bacterium]